MTSTARGNPTLVVAPTQNTAPVYEFRCLYTHDLRKKKKIWHDGSLRFHTFNRRVMAYDDSKNYIGDAHWREEGDFLEGEELRLDKGILIQVGEQVGRSETDLAPIILGKRRPEAAVSPPAVRGAVDAASDVLHSGGVIFQGRQKSLTAVLGAQQGPIGRARPSLRSPFEQRQISLQQPGDTIEERFAKRRKGNFTDKENLESPLNPSERIPSIRPNPDLVTEFQGKTPCQERRAPATAPHKRLGESTGSPRQILRSPPLPSRSIHKGQRESVVSREGQASSSSSAGGLTSGSTARRVPTCDVSSPLLQQQSKSRTSFRHPTVQSRGSGHVQDPNEARATSIQNTESTVKNKLQLSHEPRRRKLMCKDTLLRAKDSPEDFRGKQISVIRGCHRESDQVPVKFSTFETTKPHPIHDQVRDDQGREPTTLQTPVDGAKTSKPTELPEAPHSSESQNQRLGFQPAGGRCSPEKAFLQAASSHRPVRRVMSESDLRPQLQEAMSSNVSSNNIAKIPAITEQHHPYLVTQSCKNSNSIQRSFSDTTALTHRMEKPGQNGPIAAAVEACFEPWSEPEAYLLFDWWPPHMSKPSFVTK